MTEPRKVLISEMREVAQIEADNIRAFQSAMTEGGLRSAPHAGQIARAEALEAVVRLIDRISNNKAVLDLLKDQGTRGVDADCAPLNSTNQEGK